MKKHYIIYSALAVVIVVTAVFAIYKTGQAEEYAHDAKMDYQRTFTEFVQYVDDLSLNLEKSLFVNDPKQMMLLSGEIYRNAAQASANLALLPLKAEPLENISKFLSQVGNFSYSLSLKMLDGKEITKEEYDNLSALGEYSSLLASSLDMDLEQLYNGRLDIRRAATEAEDNPIDTALGEIEKELHDYPALIYDGPFSNHLTDRESVFTKGKKEITQEEAIKKARTLMGKEIDFTCVEETGSVPVYYLTGEDAGENYSVAITKKGGCLLYYLNDRECDEGKISVADAKIAGAEFLKAAGFNEMRENYYETVSSMTIINYTPEQDGYTLYPDLVKVKVAMDTGEIIGCEARGYIMYHKEREIPQIKISADEAKENISPNVEVENISLCVIPRDGGSEEFCWQIKGKIKERSCLIYVNTQNGAEEKIFLLIESPNGTLTV